MVDDKVTRLRTDLCLRRLITVSVAFCPPPERFPLHPRLICPHPTTTLVCLIHCLTDVLSHLLTSAGERKWLKAAGAARHGASRKRLSPRWAAGGVETCGGVNGDLFLNA